MSRIKRMLIHGRTRAFGFLRRVKFNENKSARPASAKEGFLLARSDGNYTPSTLPSSVVPRNMRFVTLERRPPLRKFLGDFG